jgi:hypothetical protein
VDCHSHMCGIGQFVDYIFVSSFWVQLLMSTYVNIWINNQTTAHERGNRLLDPMLAGE